MAATSCRTLQPGGQEIISQIRFETLDAWRGVAAVIVSLFHLAVFSHFSDIALIRHGWVFVNFFFVLSGFVITHAYFANLHEGHHVGSFMVRRFGRLWPLHVSVLGVLVLFELTKVVFVKVHLAVPQPLFSNATAPRCAAWSRIFSSFRQSVLIPFTAGMIPAGAYRPNSGPMGYSRRCA